MGTFLGLGYVAHVLTRLSKSRAASPGRGGIGSVFIVAPWMGRGKIRAMRPVHLLIWGLLATTIGLTPLAYASPPDPVWIPGMYDDDDQDDVVVTVTNADGSVDTPSVGPMASTCIDRRRLFDRDALRPHLVVAYSFHVRAPPLLRPLPLI